jgi:hypothetical protein
MFERSQIGCQSSLRIRTLGSNRDILLRALRIDTPDEQSEDVVDPGARITLDHLDVVELSDHTRDRRVIRGQASSHHLWFIIRANDASLGDHTSWWWIECRVVRRARLRVEPSSSNACDKRLVVGAEHDEVRDLQTGVD